MPFTIHVAMFCFRLVRNKLKGTKAKGFCACRKPSCTKETVCTCTCTEGAGFGEACLHLPFVQTVRNLYNAWKLHKLGFGTSKFNPADSAEVEAILKEVGLAGQYESFFESGPQSITQCVIILSTGRISWTQMISITISVASLTWGAGRSFFIQREDHMSDPDPPALMVLARVFFYMLTITTNSLVLWTFIGGFLGKATALALILNFVAVYFSLKLLGDDEKTDANEEDNTTVESGDRGSGESRQEEKEARESQYFCLKAAICAVWIPSVVGHKDKMYLVSAVVNLVCKVVLLCVTVGNAFLGRNK